MQFSLYDSCVIIDAYAYGCWVKPDWSRLTNFQQRSGSEQCPSNYCKHGGVCLPPISSNNESPRCLCEPGYTGQTCSQRITSCAENPCREPSNPDISGFECTDDPSGGTSYTCNCQTETSGYTGRHCEEEVMMMKYHVWNYFKRI